MLIFRFEVFSEAIALIENLQSIFFSGLPQRVKNQGGFGAKSTLGGQFGGNIGFLIFWSQAHAGHKVFPVPICFRRAAIKEQKAT